MKKKKRYRLKPLGALVLLTTVTLFVMLIVVLSSVQGEASQGDVVLQTAVETTASPEAIEEVKEQIVTVLITDEEEQHTVTINDGENVIQVDAQYEQTEKMEIFAIDTTDYKIPLMSQLTYNDETYHCSEVATLKEGIAGEYTLSNGKDIEDTYSHGAIAIITQSNVSYFE